MDKDVSKKVNSIWEIVKTVITIVLSAIFGAGIESSTSIISNLMQ